MCVTGQPFPPALHRSDSATWHLCRVSSVVLTPCSWNCREVQGHKGYLPTSVAPVGHGPFQAQYSRSSKACRGGARAAAVLEGQGSSRCKRQGAGVGTWGTPHHTASGACLQWASWESVMKVICLIHDSRGVFPEETCFCFFLRGLLPCLLFT